MTNVLTIDVDGEVATIDTKLFKEYIAEAHGYLRRTDIEKENLKLLVETVSETTKLPKAEVAKYFKNHYKSANKQMQAQANRFTAIDEAVGD